MVRLLAGRGVDPILVDDRPEAARDGLETAGSAEVHDPGSVRWGSVDVVVRSPGVGRLTSTRNRHVPCGRTCSYHSRTSCGNDRM